MASGASLCAIRSFALCPLELRSVALLEVFQRLEEGLHARVRGVETLQALARALSVEGLEVAGRQRELVML